MTLSPPDQEAIIKKALVELRETKSQLKALQSAQQEPIAIIGMSCRFPGGSINLQALWEILSQGKDTICETPSDRWDPSLYYDPDPQAVGKMYSTAGGFLTTAIDHFDPQFFEISPRETLTLDPQQRLLLEVSWEALEHAGIAPDTLFETLSGVFIGISAADYRTGNLQGYEQTENAAYLGTGNSFSTASGRLSYFLGLTGPNLAVDTACSSSLVALHLACQSLRQKECHLALAGGVNLILSPVVNIVFCRAGMLSPEGRCKTFDAAADGYVRGEGCGILVLKRLSDAQKDGDPILALIRGSAINQDGRSGGLTVPNGPAQQSVIQQALQFAKVDPSQIDYIEAHGTGTSLGDPIEVGALGNVFGSNHDSQHPLWIGSVKTNLGHLEAAAGVAGIMKVVLALQKEEIPKHLHFQNPNPLIPWRELPVKVVSEAISWKRGEKPRLAGVSSFGFSGTNAHVILEEAPLAITQEKGGIERPLHVLTLSAKSATGLEALSRAYCEYLKNADPGEWSHICYTANTSRSRFGHRLGLVAANREEALEKLGSFPAGVILGEGQGGKTAFLFTGQGSQYGGMGRELYETSPTFKEVLDQCAEILDPMLDKPLLEILYSESESLELNETRYTQPALFALEYSLAKLWMSWGIQPSLLMGHSVGEYVAACLAGVLSLEDGLKLIAERARLMQSLPSEGSMASALTNVDTVQKAIAPYSTQVSIAAYNGPESIVFSGQKQAVEAIAKDLESQGIKVKFLEVSQGFHSPLMDPMLKAFEEVVREVKYSEPKIRIISNVSGEVAGSEIATPEYWIRHVRQPVKFRQGVEALEKQGVDIYLEVGPKPVLLGMGRQCVKEDKGSWLPSLRQGQSDWKQMLESLAELYIQGIQVNWEGFHQDYTHHKISGLPSYPFQKQRYWIDSNNNDVRPLSSLHPLSSPIIDFLNRGQVEPLTTLLAGSPHLSPASKQALPEILSELVRHHQDYRLTETIKSWFYQIKWQVQSLPQPTPLSDPKTWILLIDHQGVGQTLAQSLQSQGDQCFVVKQGDSFLQLDSETYQIDPLQDFERLFHHLTPSIQHPVHGIIHLWNLDIDALTSTAEDPDWESTAQLGCGSVLSLRQTWSQIGQLGSARLWLVTCGAQIIDIDSINSINSTDPNLSPLAVGQASVWGLGRVIAQEYPFQWGGLVDLDPRYLSTSASLDPIVTHQLIQDMRDPSEDHLAYRGKDRYVARLVKAPVEEVSPLILSGNGTYLITGGLGSLGLLVAEYFVSHGARHIVLLSRREISDSVQHTLQTLESQGATVVVIRGDITQIHQMQRVFHEIQETMPPLHGIIHTAGVLKDQTLQDLKWSDFWQVMAPKVVGSWNLHLLCQNHPLDFFICFSSAAALFGSPGQANYAAANTFMDGLSIYRHQRGLPCLSINWGSWASLGMAANLAQQQQQRLEGQGISPIPTEEGLTALSWLLSGDYVGQVGVIPIQWDILGQSLHHHHLSLIKEFIAKEIRGDSFSQGQSSSSTPRLLSDLENSSEAERRILLITYLTTRIAQVMKFESSQVDPSTGFFEMGLDSLMAVELRNRLEADLGQSLNPTLLFNYPTIEALADYLISLLFGSTQEVHQNLAQEADSTVDLELGEIETLTEQDIASILAEKLKSYS